MKPLDPDLIPNNEVDDNDAEAVEREQEEVERFRREFSEAQAAASNQQRLTQEILFGHDTSSRS